MLNSLFNKPGRLRVVKGAYQESAEIAMPRTKELNNRYLKFVEQLVEANHLVSIATHDEILIQELDHRKFLNYPHVEIEMLYGIRPDLLKDLISKKYNCKIYLTYGQEWFLYLCHRIA